MTILLLFIAGFIVGGAGFNLLMSGSLPDRKNNMLDDSFMYRDRTQMMYDRILNDPNRYREPFLMNERSPDDFDNGF